MYREHLLSINHVQNLLYHQVDTGAGGRRSLRAPAFFTSQGEKGASAEFFPPGSEAERRISFFAQSLTTAVPEPLPVHAMPTFTVLTPHYSEKVRSTYYTHMLPETDLKISTLFCLSFALRFIFDEFRLYFRFARSFVKKIRTLASRFLST
jgi:hypothetical protein